LLEARSVHTGRSASNHLLALAQTHGIARVRGLGAIVRTTAGGIAALAAIVFVLPPIIGTLPSSVANSITPYLPSNAGGAVWTINPDPHTLAPWAGFALFAAYAAVSLVIAAVLLIRRDTS